MAIANSDGSIVLTTKIVVDDIKKTINQLKSNFNSLGEQKRAINDLSNSIKYSKNLIKEFALEYGKLVNRGEQYTEQGKKIQAAISREQGKISQLKSTITLLGGDSKKTFASMSAGLKNFGKRIAGILKSALIFSLLYRVMQSVVKLFQNILMSDEEFRQDWEELKAAFYTAAYPIVNLIVPAIKWIVQQVRDWAVSIGKVAAALQGMSYSELVDQAKASKKAADNYADMEKSSKKTADNVKKQLASFDDIQILSSGNEEEQGTGLAGFEGLGQYDTSGEKSMLEDLMTAIGGALAAVGLILLFKGQVGWGVGFLVAGAAFWAISEIWGEDYDPNSASDVLNNIMQTIGVSLAAIGIILLTKGILTWGFGFLIAGAAFWKITEFAEGEFSTDPVENALIKIMGILGTVLAAVGILLCIFGGPAALPWGIGFIIAGAVAFVSAAAISSEAVVEALRGPLGVIMAMAGGALLVLGIILTCTGNLTLGIPLIVAGAAALVTPIALNYEAIMNWVKNAWDAVKWFWNTYIGPVFTWQWWANLGKSCINGLIAGFEGGINGIIWAFESMINWIVDALNSLSFEIPDWVPGIGGQTWGINIPRANFGRVSIPRLAQGAVIPPNREFLAVLGDQKQGMNIEAPLQTIVDAFNIALSQNGGYNGGGNTEVVLEIDGREFGRAVVEQGNRENRRIGTRLVIV